MSPKLSRLSRLSTITLVSVYLLILVGGIVRSTGSGMGCPDWPKCFGSWVPPTEEGQLPSDYKEVYVQQRAAKNERFANYLGALGFANLADQIQSDPSILEEADFNAVKTWIEYINRLIGAVVGLLILGTFVVSLPQWNKDRPLVVATFASLVAVGVQGWIGSVVVSTNLLPWMITVHMLLALLIVALLTWVVLRAQGSSLPSFAQKNSVGITLGALLVLTLVQIVMGTQVRESVNEVAGALGETQRDRWIKGLDWVFYVHRSYSIVILLGHAYVAFKIYQIFGRHGNLIRWATVLVGVIVVEIASGAIMAYFAIPRFAQPLHLLLATVAFGIQVLLLFMLYPLKTLQRPSKKEQYVSY